MNLISPNGRADQMCSTLPFMGLQDSALDLDHVVEQQLVVDDYLDNTVNICEMKFSQNEFVIDKDYDVVLRHKLSRFLSAG